MIRQLSISDTNFEALYGLEYLSDHPLATEKDICGIMTSDPAVACLRARVAEYAGTPLLLSSIAVDEEISTPELYQDGRDYSLDYNDVVALFLASGFGVPYGSQNIRRGRVVAEVFSRKDMTTRKDSAFGSNEPFTFHIDGAALPDITPDMFVLLGIRNVEKVATTIANVKAEQLSSASLEVLSSPIFHIIYEPTHPESGVRNVPIIELNDNKEVKVIRLFGESKMGQHTNDRYSEHEINDAYEELIMALETNSQEVIINSGEALVLPNLSYVHGRKSFEDSAVVADVSRRWLKRVHIATRKELLDRIDGPGAVIATSYLT
jgi:hypothetical protein